MPSSNEYIKQQLSNILNQLSLLQLQLFLNQRQTLGVQSMIMSSRLWVISQDQFTLGRQIGGVSLATVHEAIFQGATVAAKCLYQLITASRTRRQLFKRQMEMVLQCQYQNIVTFLGATVIDPPVILMELMDTNLKRAYEQRRIEDYQDFEILYDIASALCFLHT